MQEKPPDDRNFRVIEGGKRELREHKKTRDEPTQWDTNIARVRKLAPSLDTYLAEPPVDRVERKRLLEKIYNELWALPAGGADSRNAASQRNKEKHGERPRGEDSSWMDTTDEQIAWDERYEMEFAYAIGEKMAAIEEQEAKLVGLEDHLNREAA